VPGESARPETSEFNEGEGETHQGLATSDDRQTKSAIQDTGSSSSELAIEAPAAQRDIPSSEVVPIGSDPDAEPEKSVVEQQISTAAERPTASLESPIVPDPKPLPENSSPEPKAVHSDTSVRARPRFTQATQAPEPALSPEPQARDWAAGETELAFKSQIAKAPVSSTKPEEPAESAPPAESVTPKNEPTIFVPFGAKPARQRQSVDKFKWPVQPGRSSSQDSPGEHRTAVAQPEDSSDGYQMIPVRPEELIADESPAEDSSLSASWQHIRQKQAQPADVPEMQPDVPARSVPPLIPDEEIERSFRKHVLSRQSYSAPDQSSANASYNKTNGVVKFTPFTSNTSKSERCGRCGQPGHIARNCPREKLWRRDEPGVLGTNRSDSRPPSGDAQSSEVRRFELFPDEERRSQADSADSNSPSRNFSDDNRRENRRDRWTSREGADDNTVSTKTRGSDRRDKWARDAVADEDASTDRRSSKTKSSRKDRAGRSDRYEVDEDEDYVAPAKGAKGSDRKAGRSARDEDDESAADREEARARKAARQAERAAQMAAERAAAQAEREARAAAKTLTVKLPEFVSVQNLSQALDVRYERFVSRLEELGYEDIFPGKIFNSEVSGMIALEYNYEPIFESGVHEDENRDLKALPPSEQTDLPPRPPVVTIMGHVDHGKTTILDYIRKSSVAAGEAGGITQHIGAFSVPMTSSSKPVTFLDTPGHEAFLAMRQRGANVTDIVILVVAADDSVKPQTIEAIKHAKAANVPIIVAVNKVDKPEADVQRVKQDLARHGIDIEDFGGDTQVVPVSGKTGQGMDVLEENIVTLSEILDQRASTDGQVEGWVIESSTKLSGRVATVLIRRGTLRVGDIIVAGKTWARVRTLKNEAGELQEEVGPGMPVEVDGWNEQPNAGDEVLQAPNEQKATSVVESRLKKQDRERIAKDLEVINANRQEQQIRHAKEKAAKEEARRNANAAKQAGIEIQVAPETETQDQPAEEESGQKLIPFIIKADVSGSVEAVSAYVLGVSHPLIAPKILHADVGAIHESDIDLAQAAKAHIIAFNMPTSGDIRHDAEMKGIQILENNIIYRVLDDVRAVLEAALPPLITKKVVGEAEIGQSFDINIKSRKYQKIAGCKVRNGSVKKGSLVRVLRNGEEIYDGKQIFLIRNSRGSIKILTKLLSQARSRRSKTSRKMSRRCAREPSVVWVSRNGRTSRSAIRSRLMRKSARNGICDRRADGLHGFDVKIMDGPARITCKKYLCHLQRGTPFFRRRSRLSDSCIMYA
jgi:translation initiation factor IF-2